MDVVPLKSVVPYVSGGVNVDVSAVISATHQGSSEVLPHVGPVTVVDDEDKDVSVVEVTHTAVALDHEGGILSAWRVWVPATSRMMYCRSFHRGCGSDLKKNGIP